EAPEQVLGPAVVRRFGPRLPYLLKVLAADAPLSLQAHPDADHARQAYAAEQAAGTQPRNYADPYAKPELLVAISRFETLCGFRDPGESAELLAGLKVPALDPLVDRLAAGTDGLRDVVTELLTWPAAERPELVRAVAEAAAAAVDGDYAVAVRLAEHYPGDVGVLVALLLNRVDLEPGEAIWMPAGNLHAYLRGTGIEVMAASDNVLRGGLTPKHVDVAELLRVLRFERLADPKVTPVTLAPGLVTWPTPAAEFALYEVRPHHAAGGQRGHQGATVELAAPGPRTVICVSGAVTVDDGEAPVTLRRGQAALGRAMARPLRVEGDGTAFVATTGS
ncbi:MAG TPA: mannose-6-phosphate isomerase, class I, partial [Pilimelia sp.]|nr:mannose-6-phosphate isomerase, class I [Pilimelia sp.]